MSVLRHRWSESPAESYGIFECLAFVPAKPVSHIHRSDHSDSESVAPQVNAFAETTVARLVMAVGGWDGFEAE
jgi:hypothetical protein